VQLVHAHVRDFGRRGRAALIGGGRTAPTTRPSTTALVRYLDFNDAYVASGESCHPQEIERDAGGFIRTGAALAQSPHWTKRRDPFLLETSRPGVFAASARNGASDCVGASRLRAGSFWNACTTPTKTFRRRRTPGLCQRCWALPSSILVLAEQMPSSLLLAAFDPVT
jgi:hypothetical protein